MRSDDPSTMFVPPPSSANAVGWRTGVIESWDDLTGLNSVRIESQLFNNLRVLSNGLVSPFRPGDVVGVEVIGTQYFVLGKIRAPGASLAEQIRSAEVLNFEVLAPAGAFVDLPTVGPTLTDVYIGSSRRCLVTVSGYIQVSQASGRIGVQVSGVSKIDPISQHTAVNYVQGSSDISGIATSRTFLLQSTDGLNQGLNTFKCLYSVVVNGGGTGAAFGDRTLTVQPF